jgi:accessory gene regulator protein AgrB
MLVVDILLSLLCTVKSVEIFVLLDAFDVGVVHTYFIFLMQVFIVLVTLFHWAWNMTFWDILWFGLIVSAQS